MVGAIAVTVPLEAAVRLKALADEETKRRGKKVTTNTLVKRCIAAKYPDVLTLKEREKEA